MRKNWRRFTEMIALTHVHILLIYCIGIRKIYCTRVIAIIMLGGENKAFPLFSFSSFSHLIDVSNHCCCCHCCVGTCT